MSTQIPQKNPQKGFFLYSRKSTESEDRQILSIDSQIRELKEVAERTAAVILEILSEARSAKAPGRPVFNTMMERVKKGEAEGILCWKLDRLARNPVDAGALIWAMQERNIKIITPSQTFSSGDENLLLMYIELGSAHKYINDLSKNVKRGIRAKLEKGGWPNRAPLGYLNDAATKTLIKDPERFSIVRKMWDLVLSSRHSIPKIVQIANTEWGFRTRKRKRTGGKPLSVSRAYKLFSDHFYTGWMIRYGNRYRGTYDPMVTETEFERVQEILGKPGKPKPHHHTFPFTGLIRCGNCGCMVTAEEKYNRYGYHYVYYRCTKKKRDTPCPERYIEAKALESQIIEYLKKIQIPESLFDWTMKYLKEDAESNQQSRKDIIATLEKSYQGTQKQIENLTRMRLRELLTDEEYLKEKESLLKEQHNLETRLIEAREGGSSWYEAALKVFEFSHQAVSWFQKGSMEDKRIILDAIGSNLTLKDKRLLILAKKPFQIISEGLMALRGNFGRLEPENFSMVKIKTGDPSQQFPVMSGLVEDIRTFFQFSPEADSLKFQLEKVFSSTAT